MLYEFVVYYGLFIVIEGFAKPSFALTLRYTKF